MPLHHAVRIRGSRSLSYRKSSAFFVDWGDLFRRAVKRAASAAFEIEVGGKAPEIACKKHRGQHLPDFDCDTLIYIQALVAEPNPFGTRKRIDSLPRLLFLIGQQLWMNQRRGGERPADARSDKMIFGFEPFRY